MPFLGGATIPLASKTFIRKAGISHREINVQQGPRVLDGVFHIQSVNAYDSRLKT